VIALKAEPLPDHSQPRNQVTTELKSSISDPTIDLAEISTPPFGEVLPSLDGPNQQAFRPVDGAAVHPKCRKQVARRN
jgi:hypothetical protein